MERKLTYMQKYEYFQDDFCRNAEDDLRKLRNCLKRETIIQGRYIIGGVQRVCREHGTIIYIGLDMVFDRAVLIHELYLSGYFERQEDATVQVQEAEAGFLKERVSEYVEVGRRLIRLHKEKDILTVYSSFLENNTGYIVTAYMDIETNLERIQLEKKKIEPAQAVRFLDMTLAAVEKIKNECNISIRFGPENVYICPDQTIKFSWLYSNAVYGLEPADYKSTGELTELQMAARFFSKITTGRELGLVQAKHASPKTTDHKLAPYMDIVARSLSEKGKTDTADELVMQLRVKEESLARYAGKSPRRKQKLLLCFGTAIFMILLCGMVFAMTAGKQKEPLLIAESEMSDVDAESQKNASLWIKRLFFSEESDFAGKATPSEAKESKSPRAVPPVN